MKKFISVLALTLIAALMFSACSAVSMTEDELKKIAAPLIEKSYEINEIYFGKGLPVDEDAAALSGSEEDGSESYDVKSVKYVPVRTDDYKNIEDLQNAAAQVYTDSFLEGLFPATFQGVRDEKGGIVSYAKYIENFGGSELQQRADLADDSILVGRVFDTDTIKIKNQVRGYVFFTVESYVDGKPDGTVELSIKDEGKGWRLDSPTY